MDLRPLIHKKRRGLSLTGEEIRDFIAGVVAGEIPDFQIAAFLMTIVHLGMDFRETVDLTREMAAHGEILSRHPGRKRVGKHSTGGVGDKTTFILGPLVSHFGPEATFMSGRGLGHTGGTIDKLSGIVGLKTALSPREVRRLLKSRGFCIFEQTPSLVPADRRLYALRDLSGTVESIPLIVSSILSKKIAEGLHGLVLDVKFGSGSLMGSLKHAKDLAKMLLSVARALGLKATAVLTSMEQPLGQMVGNNLEILECLEVLRGHGPEDLNEANYILAREMLRLALPRKRTLDRQTFRELLLSGVLAECFLETLRQQGGNLEHAQSLQLAPRRRAVLAPRGGWIRAVDARIIGEACMELGAGRKGAGEPIDPAVGIWVGKKVGERVRKGEKLLEILYRSESHLKKVLPRLGQAIQISPQKVRPAPLVAGIFKNWKRKMN